MCPMQRPVEVSMSYMSSSGGPGTLGFGRVSCTPVTFPELSLEMLCRNACQCREHTYTACTRVAHLGALEKGSRPSKKLQGDSEISASSNLLHGWGSVAVRWAIRPFITISGLRPGNCVSQYEDSWQRHIRLQHTKKLTWLRRDH